MTEPIVLRCRAANGACQEPAAWRIAEDERLISVTTQLPELICEGHAQGVREILRIYTGELGGIGVRLVRIAGAA